MPVPKYVVAPEQEIHPPPRSAPVELDKEHQALVHRARETLMATPDFHRVGILFGRTRDGRKELTLVVTADDVWVEFAAVRSSVLVDPGV